MSGKHSFAVVAAESLALFVNAAELSVADYCVLCTSGPVLSIEGLRSILFLFLETRAVLKELCRPGACYGICYIESI